MKGFTEFIREQGVVGLAVGFILGGAISKVVASIVNDLINPLLGLILGATGGLAMASLTISGTTIYWGRLASNLVDFVVIAFVVYFGVKKLGLDKLDRKK